MNPRIVYYRKKKPKLEKVAKPPLKAKIVYARLPHGPVGLKGWQKET